MTPSLRFTPSGAAVANFTVASTPRTFDRQSNEWKDGETLFMRCSVWRDAAENVAESLQRGTRVIVTGRLKSRSYETKEGEKRTVIEMDVDEVGPSMKYATAKVNKTSRGGGGGGFGGDQGGSGQSDPWATGGSAPQGGGGQGGQQGGWNQQGGGAPAAPQQGSQGQQGGQGGWGNAPAYDEPPSDRHTHHRSTPSLGDQGSSAEPAQQKESTTMAKPVVRKPKKKANPLKAAKVENIDYKDTALLRKFISDRGKIRARRVTGVSVQEQRLIANAVKNAREMALLPYSRLVPLTRDPADKGEPEP